MLRQAHHEHPDDKIYKMAYLGSLDSKKEEYKKAEFEAGSEVLKRFQGPGLLNRYFIQVLGRKKMKRLSNTTVYDIGCDS